MNAQEGFFMDGEEKAFTREDFRFTYKAGSVYAFQLRPEGREVCIRTLAEKGMFDLGIDHVQLLGCDETIIWQRTSEGLRILIPDAADTRFPVCFKIRLK